MNPQKEDIQKKKNLNTQSSTDTRTFQRSDNVASEEKYKLEIVWRNVFMFFILHVILVNILYTGITGEMKPMTLLFSYLYGLFGGFGITAGAHRLWTHRTYKANLPVRIFLMLGQTAALQNDIHEWSRDHRVHHKFTDTNADPHNINRGFFFAHMGWLMCKKHKDVFVKGNTVDMTDILADPVVKFQMKYYMPLIALLAFVIPALIPWYFWGEDACVSFFASVGRLALSLHGTWLVNSAAHFWGMKPYDKTIKATENKYVAILAFGEGWHNYHHVFPWDYKTAELGDYKYNITTCFLDFMGKIGWATEMKTASKDMIEKRVLRAANESLFDERKLKTKNNNEEYHQHHHDDEMIWGWGDNDMDKEQINEITRHNRVKD